MAVVFGVLDEDRLKWRGLRICDEERERIEAAVIHLCREPIVVEWAELLEAA
jgi:hypothetical protein